MRRCWYGWLLGLVAIALAAVPATAFAVDSFVGTLTASSVLASAVDLMPYFLPVVGIVVGIGLAIWAIEWLIGSIRGALGHK